jgi:hypothetical protein
MTDSDRSKAQNDMEDGQYPGLYQSADAASLTAQSTYLLLQRVHLGSLVLGSTIGAFTALGTEAVRMWLYSAIAIILALGLLGLWVTYSRNDDKVWFDCRAIAESTKTATWRFMMGAPPFSDGDSVEERFVFELREIREARPHANRDIAGQIDANAPAITRFMREVRVRAFGERQTFYIDCRLSEQKIWYSKKANTHARSGTHWFWATAGLQALAVAIAIIEAASAGFRINAVPVLTTCAAAVAAWTQMKRHNELAQTYALAAQELGELHPIAAGLTDEGKFGQLVAQVEEAISREHTMWCARRDVVLTGSGQR